MNLSLHPMPLARVGIIGGGQLGRMMSQRAKKLGCHVVVLDPTPDSPAGQVSMRQVIGSFEDPERIRELAEMCDVTTYDIEHIHTETLKTLAAEGHRVVPSPALLDLIQDKLSQKELFETHGLPTPRFERMDAPDAGAMAAFGYPLVQKARRGGYDGRGVMIHRGPEDFPNALPDPSLIEEAVELEKELAVMVARNANGEIKSFPVVEMTFDPRANLLDLLLSPARIEPQLARDAQELALETVRALDGEGIFGIELFLSKSGRLFVNEVAPRPHNSGHHTIEACITDQFEQHFRAILNLPLGATDQLCPAVMLNLLGEEGYRGEVIVEGMQEVLAMAGVSVHLYGKKETRPYRKMGHVTILDADLDRAREKAERVKRTLRILGKERME
jgi:5-(carboxyamino)imidazole ribonucleotide synthase